MGLSVFLTNGRWGHIQKTCQKTSSKFGILYINRRNSKSSMLIQILVSQLEVRFVAFCCTFPSRTLEPVGTQHEHPWSKEVLFRGLKNSSTSAASYRAHYISAVSLRTSGPQLAFLRSNDYLIKRSLFLNQRKAAEARSSTPNPSFSSSAFFFIVRFEVWCLNWICLQRSRLPSIWQQLGYPV